MSKIVYAEEGWYAGWPANHGAWQWADGEWLVGFLRGKYRQKSMHNIAEPYEYCFARSRDEGETWNYEDHLQEFEAGVVVHPAPDFDMRSSIRRCCGVYDHGGDDTDPRSGFFLSHGRGVLWEGPYLFTGLDEQFNGIELCGTSRQCELPEDGLIFLSNGMRDQWGQDRTFVAHHDGKRFEFISYLDLGDARCVMPAVAKLRERLVVVCRRRKGGRCWIDSFVSDDKGHTWSLASWVADTGGSNGNPPALIESGGWLYCVYGNRESGTIRLAMSRDGERWVQNAEPIAHGIKSQSGYYDLGYPRLLKRHTGSVVALYYIATEEIPWQHIEMEDL